MGFFWLSRIAFFGDSIWSNDFLWLGFGYFKFFEMRFASKKEFVATIDKEWVKLITYLETLSAEDMALIPEEREGSMERSGDAWSAKDVLAHVYEWNRMTLRWFESGKDGEPDIPAKGYTWKTAPELNRAIYQKYKDHPLVEVQDLFFGAHKQAYDVVAKLSEDDLLRDGAYKWAGDLPLASYLGSCTLSHYRWAYVTIKKIVKQGRK